MRIVAGAILILAEAILIAAGMIADAVDSESRSVGRLGYVLGGVIGIVGLFMMVSGITQAGDAIPENKNENKKDR